MRKAFLYLGILLFFMSGTVYVTDDFKYLQQPFLLAGIGILFLLSGSKHTFVLRQWRPDVKGMYSLWVFGICLSFIAHFESSMIITIVGLSLIGFTANSWLPNAINRTEIDYKGVFDIVKYATIAIFLYSLIKYGFRLIRYEGVFGNSNSFGGVVATFGGIVCASLVFDMNRIGVKFTRLLLDFALVILALLGTLISNSRTCLVTMIVAVALAVVLIVKSSGTVNKHFFSRIVLFFVVTSFVLVALYLFTDIKHLADPIIRKIEYKSSIDNEWGGRDILWGNIIRDFKFFGNGETTTNSAHSTYMSMLDKYGAIGFLGWALFVLSGTIKALIISFSRKNCNPYIYYALFSFLILLLTGIPEVMMLKTAMLLAVASTPLLTYELDGCELLTQNNRHGQLTEIKNEYH